jgi:hypothetical protein
VLQNTDFINGVPAALTADRSLIGWPQSTEVELIACRKCLAIAATCLETEQLKGHSLTACSAYLASRKYLGDVIGRDTLKRDSMGYFVAQPKTVKGEQASSSKAVAVEAMSPSPVKKSRPKAVPDEPEARLDEFVSHYPVTSKRTRGCTSEIFEWTDADTAVLELILKQRYPSVKYKGDGHRISHSNYTDLLLHKEYSSLQRHNFNIFKAKVEEWLPERILV